MLSRSERRLRLDRTWPASNELDALFAKHSTETAGPRRDRAFVEWRFARSPVFRYDVAFAYEDDQLVGYLATRRVNYEGYDTTFIIDAYGSHRLMARDWTAVALHLVKAELTLDGPELLMLIGNSAAGPLALLSRLPFVRVPTRLLPQAAPVFAQWWSRPAFEFTSESLPLSLADCDML